MPTGNAKFQAAADEASCSFLLSAGGTAASVAAYSLLTGNLVVGGLAAAATGIAVYAYGKGCQWDSDTGGDNQDITLACCPPNYNPFEENQAWYWKAFNNATGVWFEQLIGVNFTSSGQYTRGYLTLPGVIDENGRWNLEGCNGWVDRSGVIPAHYFSGGDYSGIQMVPPQGTGCDPEPTPLPPPYTYTDPDDGCQIQVTMLGWGVDEAGNYTPVWQMDPILPPAAARSTGGIIGGCNFSPVIYYDGPGGPVLPPVPPVPVPGPGGEPWWLSPLLGALGGATALAIDKALEKLFETPIPQWQYTMRAACDYKEDGSYETQTITLPAAPYQERMLQLAETQLDFLQQHLLWKTPVCFCGSPPDSGDPVTINWISDEVSPASGTRLNKIFTYFDQNNTSLADTVSHWKDFTWQSGPVVVSCCGTDLGKPQVWAASLAEAKRVIGHAAQVAGVDLTNAEWLTGTPRSARNGVPATMRVLSRRGVLGITKRSGPNGYPEGLPG
jgi:hypothetical protein